jgi:hypothetical protein
MQAANNRDIAAHLRRDGRFRHPFDQRVGRARVHRGDGVLDQAPGTPDHSEPQVCGPWTMVGS